MRDGDNICMLGDGSVVVQNENVRSNATSVVNYNCTLKEAHQEQQYTEIEQYEKLNIDDPDA